MRVAACALTSSAARALSPSRCRIRPLHSRAGRGVTSGRVPAAQLRSPEFYFFESSIFWVWLASLVVVSWPVRYGRASKTLNPCMRTVKQHQPAAPGTRSWMCVFRLTAGGRPRSRGCMSRTGPPRCRHRRSTGSAGGRSRDTECRFRFSSRMQHQRFGSLSQACSTVADPSGAGAGPSMCWSN